MCIYKPPRRMSATGFSGGYFQPRVARDGPCTNAALPGLVVCSVSCLGHTPRSCRYVAYRYAGLGYVRLMKPSGCISSARSYELTRKDRLCKNIERMKYIRGAKHFDFIPPSYIMPTEYQVRRHLKGKSIPSLRILMNRDCDEGELHFSF